MSPYLLSHFMGGVEEANQIKLIWLGEVFDGS